MYSSERLEKLSVNMMNIRFKMIIDKNILQLNKQLENVREIVNSKNTDDLIMDIDSSEKIWNF